VSALDVVRTWLTRSPKATTNAGSAIAAVQMLPAKVGKQNVPLYRHWAEHSEWVRTAINIRKNQVSGAEWDIGPIDPEKPYSVRMAKRLTELFRSPNPKDGDFRTFIEQVVEDILVLDAGAIEKVRSLVDETVELWPVDGGTVKVNRFWDGDPDEERYYWFPDHQQRAAWLNRDFVYLMQNVRTYIPVGLSPLETLKVAVDAELSGMNYNKRQVERAAPDGMMDLGEGVRPEQVDAFKAYWNAEVAGQGAMAFIGGSKGAKFVPFKGSNRDMQFLEWQIYLVRKIAGVFGLTPQDLGVTFDVNRSTSETQQENSEDRGVRPLLGLVASSLTREIVWGDEFGGPESNLAFRFTRLNLKESLSRAQINKLALAGMPWKTIDEARREDGREPLGGMYATLMANTPRGVVTLDDIPNAREVSQQDSGAADGNGSSSGEAAAAQSELIASVQEV
jgi:phage portal protein BeeE